MTNPKPVKSYWVCFRPDSEDKAPPRYVVYVSTSENSPSLHSATVMAMNTDAPAPRDGSSLGFWNRAAQTSPDDLIVEVNNELRELNHGKEIQRSKVRWI